MSRQQEYQKKKIAQGLCSTCGKRPLFNSSRCRHCYQKIVNKKRAITLARHIKSKKRETKILREVRRRILPFARIDPQFQYVKIGKILRSIAKEHGIGVETLREKYNIKQLLRNKSILERQA